MSCTQTMLYERQINMAELTLAGRTAQYIANRFQSSICTIRQIRKRYRKTGRWQHLSGSGHPKKRRRLADASNFAHWPKSHWSLLHTLDIQLPSELSREGSLVRQSTALTGRYLVLLTFQHYSLMVQGSTFHIMWQGEVEVEVGVGGMGGGGGSQEGIYTRMSVHGQ